MFDIPDDIAESLSHYINSGIPTGDFLRAVLCNDLMDAAARADSTNRFYLASIALWVREYVPFGAYGSRDKVDAWIEQRGLVGFSKT